MSQTRSSRARRWATSATIGLAITGATFIAWQAEATGVWQPAAPTAVATIDLVSVLDGLEEKATLEQRLQQSLDDRQAQLDQLITELERAQQDIQTLTPGTEDYREAVRKAIELQNLAQTRRQILEQIVSVERATMLRDLYNKIEGAVKRVAERDGIDIVLMDDSAFPLPQGDVADRDMERAILNRSIIFRTESVNITSRVVTLMNNEFAAP